MLEKENMKLSWSVPQISEIKISLTETQDPPPGKGQGGPEIGRAHV